jgi:hypothetical protein
MVGLLSSAHERDDCSVGMRPPVLTVAPSSSRGAAPIVDEGDRMEPISPELVLVDPELAVRARRQLRNGGQPTSHRSNGFHIAASGAVAPVSSRISRAHRVVAPALAAPPEQARPRSAQPLVPFATTRRSVSAAEAYATALKVGSARQAESAPPRRRRVVAWGGISILAGAAGVALAFLLTEAAPTTDVRLLPRAASLPDEGRTPNPRRDLRRSTAPAPSSVRPRPGSTAKPAAQPRAAATPERPRSPRRVAPKLERPRGAPPVARSTFVPARVFGWVPQRGADYYNVRFFRGTRTIFEAWPTQPRLILPRGMRFGRGTYRWVVRPAFGPRAQARFGKPIVESKFAVP